MRWIRKCPEEPGYYWSRYKNGLEFVVWITKPAHTTTLPFLVYIKNGKIVRRYAHYNDDQFYWTTRIRTPQEQLDLVNEIIERSR